MLQIKKRDNSLVSFNPTKIYNRIKKSCKGLKVNDAEIFIKVITSVPTEGVISTIELDKLISEIGNSYTGTHHDYSLFASSVSITSYYKKSKESFSDTMIELNEQGIVHDDLIKTINSYGKDKIDKVIEHTNDEIFDYFAWKTLENVYLLKNSKGESVERPQHMYMRVALWVTKSFKEAVEYYKSLSNQLISPATPIMINSGTKNPQLASCVLTMNEGDDRKGLLNTFNDICSYSSDAAGIGLSMSNIRSKESKIKTSGGNAGGLLKYLKIVNEGLRFFNQQGRRPGSAAIYLEIWHKDIYDLLELKKNTGADELRARDLFTALWIPDNFMRALKNDSEYYLFCPNDILKSGLRPLYELYGEEFEIEYNKAVELGLGKKIKARDLGTRIVESQIETGVPYIGFKDNVNNKSNHKNIGTIKQMNLCIEVAQFTDSKTTAICTLSALILKAFVEGKEFNYDLLYQETRKITKALNKVIDINYYSTEKGEKGGREQRAIGIGVQGLADVFFLLDLVFTSEEAKEVNKKIFETIYFGALTESMELCKSKEYKPYDFFEGSPISKGEFQFNLWNIKEETLSGLWDWNKLRKDIIKYGVCNSLVTALMPTESSSRVTGSYEKEEVVTSNLHNKRVNYGEFTILNRYLINDFEKIGIWSETLRTEVILNNGSIQAINFNKYLDQEDKNYEKKVKRIEHLIKKYKTIWEVPQKELIKMAADRGPFIDQSQSMNIYMADPTLSKLLSSMIFSWESGLKTGSYYTRTKAISTGAKHLAIDMSKEQEKRENDELQQRIKEEMKNLPAKPENSQFDCFGCSS